jgi:hypothetical protein
VVARSFRLLSSKVHAQQAVPVAIDVDPSDEHAAVAGRWSARSVSSMTRTRRHRSWRSTCRSPGPPRRYFSAKLGDPVEQFEAEASAHPVFELLPLQ